MAMKLSNLTFIDEDDIVSASGVEQILNAELVNTITGDDRITGTGNNYSFNNVSVLDDIDEGNDTITGIEDLQPSFGSSYDIVNFGMLNKDEDNDILTGISQDDAIINSGKLSADEDNDILTGITSRQNPYSTNTFKIHSIKCLLANKDPIGPDDTYIEINGSRIWGDYNMHQWWHRAVDYSVDISQYPRLWVELFDDDNHWSANDSIGGFTPKNTNGRVVMEKVGFGSYEVYYSLDVDSPLAYPSITNRDYTLVGTENRSEGRRNTSTRTSDYTSGGTRNYTSGGTRSTSGGTRNTSEGTSDYTSGGTQSTSGGTRDYSIGQDYTSVGIRDYSIGQDYTSGGTRGEKGRMSIQF